MVSIKRIEGIGETKIDSLTKAGIRTTDSLLKATRTAAGRRRLSDQTGMSESEISHFVDRSRLLRVTGVGTDYADLLNGAGVATIADLGRRNPKNLAARLGVVNQEQKLVRRLPTEVEVGSWIRSARRMTSPALDASTLRQAAGLDREV